MPAPKSAPLTSQTQDSAKTVEAQQNESIFSPSIFNTHEEYVIITTPEQVKEISNAILKSQPEPILGVDCEGLTKGRPLCLL